MRYLDQENLSKNFLRVDPKLHRANLLPEEQRLSAADKLLLSDVLSFHLTRKTYFKAIASIKELTGMSRSSVTRQLRRLHDLGYLVVETNNRSINQTNNIELGPATLRLFTDEGAEGEQDIPSPVEAQQTEAPSRPRHETPKPPLPNAPRPTVAEPVPTVKTEVEANSANALLVHPSEIIPKTVLSTLNYYPKEGRVDLTLGDAIKVFALFGVAPDRAKHYHAWRTESGWQFIENKLDDVKAAAAQCRDNPKAFPDPSKNIDYGYDLR